MPSNLTHSVARGPQYALRRTLPDTNLTTLPCALCGEPKPRLKTPGRPSLAFVALAMRLEARARRAPPMGCDVPCFFGARARN